MSTSLPIMLGAPVNNQCGECTACCDAIGSSALGKPYYTRCKHVANGCSIYESRPHGCQIYRCAWHLGLLGDKTDRRPDQCGVLFQIEPEGRTCSLEIYELSAGAADSEKAKYLKQIILNNRHFQKLPLAKCYVRVYPFGSDIPVTFAIAQEYAHAAPPAEDGKIHIDPHSPSEGRFEGQTRALAFAKVPDVEPG